MAGALPKALRARGIDVRVVMPLYAGMPWNDFEILDGLLTVPMWWGPARARVRTGRLPDSEVPLYCLEFNRYFDRPYLYGPPGEATPTTSNGSRSCRAARWRSARRWGSSPT